MSKKHFTELLTTIKYKRDANLCSALDERSKYFINSKGSLVELKLND